MPVSHQPALHAPSDADLVESARCGDASALGLLLERHRPRLYATALRLLGYRVDAEDAVQETCLAALRHIGTVRDPESFGAWLQVVLRRACLQHARRLRGERLADEIPEITDESATPEERLDRLELREWIWGSLQRLAEPLRVTAMLRYFGSYDSYDELAAILGVPIGTVRSRLSEVKAKLATALLASAGLAANETHTLTRQRERYWADAFEDIFRRGDSERFVRRFSPDLLVAWSHGRVIRGREHLAAEIESDLAAGVRLYTERVMTHDGIAVVEGRFVNPPHAPNHCPPGVALVVFDGDDLASRIRLHLSPRLPRPSED